LRSIRGLAGDVSINNETTTSWAEEDIAHAFQTHLREALAMGLRLAVV